jgi:leucyl aminopeptidase
VIACGQNYVKDLQNLLADMSNYTVFIKYKCGDKNEAPIVLVGKSLVFDNGGICIKPSKGMDSIKMDINSAAAVMGTMKTLAMLNLPISYSGS